MRQRGASRQPSGSADAGRRRIAGGRRERESRLLSPRLVLLFLAGCLLFGYPFLAVFSRSGRVAGVPVLFLYVFVAWAAFIAVLARLVDSGGRRR